MSMTKSRSSPGLSGRSDPFSDTLAQVSQSSSQSLFPGAHAAAAANPFPTGMSTAMKSRMRLDATCNPHMIALRMNNQNLKNEMMLHRGKIVSNQFALMKPRPKTTAKPKVLVELPVHMDKTKQDKMAKVAEMKEKDEAIEREAAAALEKALAASSPKDEFQTSFRSKKLQRMKSLAPEDPMALEQTVSLIAESAVEDVYMPMEVTLHGIGTGMPHDKVSKALLQLGFQALEEAHVMEVVNQVATGGPLSLDEFAKVVVVFEKHRSREMWTQFHELDSDGSGAVSSRELRHLLWDRGFTVSIDAVEEILNEVDDNTSGEIDFTEFSRAVQIIDIRRGFTKQESEDLFSLFDRYDDDGSGEITCDELASLLGYFGTPTSIKQAQKVVSSFDVNGDLKLGREEFLAVMRIRLEDEIADLRTLFAEFDVDQSGTIDSSEVLPLIHSLSYSVQPDVIDEAISDVVQHKGILDGGLVFEDILKVIRLIRQQEGFNKEEVKELVDVFKKHDQRGEDQLRDFELARALNWLGYPLSHQKRRQYWCKVDVDKTDSIDSTEFLKFVRLLREDETATAKQLIACSQGADDSAYLRESDLRELLNRMGYTPPVNIVSEAAKQSSDSSGDGKTDLVGVLGIFRHIRENQVRRLRENAGLPDNVASKVRGKFGLRIEAGKLVLVDEVERFMVSDVFKTAAKCPEERKAIMDLLEQRSDDGMLDLTGIYWAVRLYGDKRDEAAWQREQDAAQAANFSNTQVAQFRSRFVEADRDGSGALCQKEIQSIFDQLLKLTPEQVQTLNGEFATAKDGYSEHVDFPEFLRMMRVVDVGSMYCVLDRSRTVGSK